MAVVEFDLLPKWFDLDSRTQRDMVNQLTDLISRYPAVALSWFDADSWTSEVSDFVAFEFEDLKQYNEMWSEIRRHPFLATPYARVANILMGMELEVEGLAQVAQPAELRQSDIAIELGSLELPPETGKPRKPLGAQPLARPPKVLKPAKRDTPRESSKSETRACHFCGHLGKKSSRFCSRCGTATNPL